MFTTAFFIFFITFAVLAGPRGVVALLVAMLLTLVAGLVAKYMLKLDIYKRGG